MKRNAECEGVTFLPEKEIEEDFAKPEYLDGRPVDNDIVVSRNTTTTFYKACPWPLRILGLLALLWIVFSFWALPLYLIGVWKP